jgi:hypothetical protein
MTMADGTMATKLVEAVLAASMTAWQASLEAPEVFAEAPQALL